MNLEKERKGLFTFSYDENIFKEFYADLPPIVYFKFSTNLILRWSRFSFSRDDVINLLYLFDVEEPSFPIIL